MIGELTLGLPVVSAAAAEPYAAQVSARVAELVGVTGAVHLIEHTGLRPAVWADGRRCPYPYTALADIASYLARTAAQPVEDPLAVIAGSGEKQAEGLALLCREAVGPDVNAAGIGSDRADAEVVVLEIEPSHLHEVATVATRSMRSAREILTARFGVALPGFHVRLDPTLPRGGFAIRVRHHRSLPRIGLPPRGLLVQSTVEELAALDVTAEPFPTTALSGHGSLVDVDRHDALNEAGLTTWSAEEYLALHLLAEVRRRMPVVVDPAFTEDLLASLVPPDSVLGRACASRVPPDVLLGVLRALVGDGVPIGDLPRIVELLVSTARAGTPDDLAGWTVAVRHGLRRVVADAAAGHGGPLVVYLVQPATEAAVASPETADLALEAMEDALHEELAGLAGGRDLAVLVSDASRATVAGRLRGTFPELHVLGFGDVPPDTAVLPIQRLRTTGAATG